MYDKNLVISGVNNGYYYFIDYTHPLATGNSGRVYLHRHIASIKIGRWLTSDEYVHHIDEDKLNNSEDNLYVLSNSEHIKLHKNEITSRICPICKVKFTPTQNSIKYCSHECASISSIKEKSLTKELLDNLIPNNSWVTLGKMFGYSDTGIKKRAKSLGCNIPKRR